MQKSEQQATLQIWKIPFPTSLHTPTPGLTQWLGGAEELASSVEMEIWAFSSRPRDAGTLIWRRWAAVGAPRGQADRLKTETTPNHKGKMGWGWGALQMRGGRREVPFVPSVVGSHRGNRLEVGETDSSCTSGGNRWLDIPSLRGRSEDGRAGFSRAPLSITQHYR